MYVCWYVFMCLHINIYIHVYRDARTRMFRALAEARTIFCYTHLLESFFMGQAFASARHSFVRHPVCFVEKMKNEKWTMKCGKNEKWEMKNEKWKMKNAKWNIKNDMWEKTTYPCVWRDSYTCAIWHLKICDITHSRVLYDTLKCVTWRVWHDWFIGRPSACHGTQEAMCLTSWLIHGCHVTHIRVSDMTRL